MTIQPLFWPFDLLRTTFATTPSPRVTSRAVPMTSPRNGLMSGRIVVGSGFRIPFQGSKVPGFEGSRVRRFEGSLLLGWSRDQLPVDCVLYGLRRSVMAG